MLDLPVLVAFELFEADETKVVAMAATAAPPFVLEVVHDPQIVEVYVDV